MASDYRITPLSCSVHLAKENPLFGRTATHVSIEDEGAGPYLRLTQNETHGDGVALEWEELQTVVIAAENMLTLHKKGEWNTNAHTTD
jgi:hypothetical protein